MLNEHEYKPYIRVACATLLRAIEDHQDNIKLHGPSAADAMSAAAYLRSMSERPWGIRWICEQIGVQHHKIVARMNERGLIKQLRGVVRCDKAARIKAAGVARMA